MHRHDQGSSQAIAARRGAGARGLGVVVGLVVVIAPGAFAETPTSSNVWELPVMPFHYERKGRRDPFSPLVVNGRLVKPVEGTQTQKGVLNLQGLFWDPTGHSMALINNTEVKVGDHIEGYRVMDIRPEAVIVSDGEKPLVLQIIFDTSTPTSASGATSKGGQPK